MQWQVDLYFLSIQWSICSSLSGVEAQQRRSISFVLLRSITLSFPLPSESLPEQTYKDESDAATLRQTLPDLTPDDPSDAPALPAEDSASAPAEADAAEVEEPADAGDQEGEESPNKSPSKKKKKFRTPSFLKKNKKKTDS